MVKTCLAVSILSIQHNITAPILEAFVRPNTVEFYVI